MLQANSGLNAAGSWERGKQISTPTTWSGSFVHIVLELKTKGGLGGEWRALSGWQLVEWDPISADPRGTSRLGCSFRVNLPQAFFSMRGYDGNLRP